MFRIACHWIWRWRNQFVFDPGLVIPPNDTKISIIIGHVKDFVRSHLQVLYFVLAVFLDHGNTFRIWKKPLKLIKIQFKSSLTHSSFCFST